MKPVQQLKTPKEEVPFSHLTAKPAASGTENAATLRSQGTASGFNDSILPSPHTQRSNQGRPSTTDGGRDPISESYPTRRKYPAYLRTGVPRPKDWGEYKMRKDERVLEEVGVGRPTVPVPMLPYQGMRERNISLITDLLCMRQMCEKCTNVPVVYGSQKCVESLRRNCLSMASRYSEMSKSSYWSH